jgi:uncharacterized protein (TIGR03435 family)
MVKRVVFVGVLGIVVLLTSGVGIHAQAVGARLGAGQAPTSVVDEVAEIKLGNRDLQQLRIRIQGNRLDIDGTLRDLIAVAYEIPTNTAANVVIGPAFLSSERFAIVANLPPSTAHPMARSAPPVRRLLEQRFGLVTHTEERPIAVFALATSRKPHKLAKSAGGKEPGCKPRDPIGDVNVLSMVFDCHSVTMPDLVKHLSRVAPLYVDRPAVDATGLPGTWDFSISWTPWRELPDSTSRGGLSMFEAVERQLGLTMKRETRRVPVIVVDKVAQTPRN